MRILGIILMGFTVAAALLGANINGTWEGDMHGRNGDAVHVEMNLKANEGVLTGTLRTAAGETEIEHGEVDGEYILFNVVREANGNQVTQKYRGHVNAETIDFTLTTVGPGGERTQDFIVKKIGS